MTLVFDAASKISSRVSLFAKWFAGLGLLVMTAIVALQVFARYVLNDSPAWAEQTALLLMIWYVFIAAAAGVRERFHIRIAVFVDGLPRRFRLPVSLAAHFLVVGFGCAMVVYGIELARETWHHSIPTLGISRGFAYIPIAVSGTLIAGFGLEQALAEFRSTEVSQRWN